MNTKGTSLKSSREGDIKFDSKKWSIKFPAIISSPLHDHRPTLISFSSKPRLTGLTRLSRPSYVNHHCVLAIVLPPKRKQTPLSLYQISIIVPVVLVLIVLVIKWLNREHWCVPPLRRDWFSWLCTLLKDLCRVGYYV